MKRRLQLTGLFVLWAIVATLFPLTFAGCANSQQAQQYLAARQKVEAYRAPATQAIADIGYIVKSLPADDPLRQSIEPNLDKLNEYLSRADVYVQLIDALARPFLTTFPATQPAVSP